MYLFTHLKKIMKLRKAQKNHRKNNSHNYTVLHTIVPQNKLTVGKGTYGNLYIRTYNIDSERLFIGHYVSIADNVTFLLGGCHYIQRFSSYNFLQKYGDKKADAFSKGPIIIEDDVYIGHGATILSGVTIGKGAVIGAGAVVAKDIPPYAVAVGNPCVVKKFRFSSEIIDILASIDFSKIEPTKIINNPRLFTTTLTDPQQVEQLIDQL